MGRFVGPPFACRVDLRLSLALLFGDGVLVVLLRLCLGVLVGLLTVEYVLRGLVRGCLRCLLFLERSLVGHAVGFVLVAIRLGSRFLVGLEFRQPIRFDPV